MRTQKLIGIIGLSLVLNFLSVQSKADGCTWGRDGHAVCPYNATDCTWGPDGHAACGGLSNQCTWGPDGITVCAQPWYP